MRIGRREIVRGVAFDVRREQTLGIVGESGSGKTMTALAATGLLDTPGAVVNGSSMLGGKAATQLIGASPRLLRSVHGGRIGFVFQDPGTSLNPLLTLERQITESLETHRKMTRRQANMRALELLEAVGLPDPQTRLHAYPHQLSGGQRQRVMIAIALACDPELLIADEPTTSLDVTTQAQIIDVVRRLQRDFGTAVVWISHDLGVIGQVADDVTVLRDGEIVEQAPILDVFDEPQNTYTRELLRARPLVGRSEPAPAPDDAPVLLRVDGLDVRFAVTTPVGRSTVHAVRRSFIRDSPGHDTGTGRRVGLGQVNGCRGADRTRRTGRRAPHRWTVQTYSACGVPQGKRCAAGSVWSFRIRSRRLNPRIRVQTAIDEPLRVHRLAEGKLPAWRGWPAARTRRPAHSRSPGDIRTNCRADSVSA